MKKLYELEYKYTFEHYNRMRSLADNTTSIIAFLWIVILSILAGVDIWGFTIETLINIIKCTGALSIFFVTAILLLPSTYRQHYNSDKGSKDKMVTIEFYKDHIIQKTDISTYKAYHKDIHQVLKDKYNYYLIVSSKGAIIIPKNKLNKEMEQYIKDIKK